MIFKVSPHSLEGLLLQFTCTQKLIAALAAATVVVIIVFLNVYPGHLSFLYRLFHFAFVNMSGKVDR